MAFGVYVSKGARVEEVKPFACLFWPFYITKIFNVNYLMKTYETPGINKGGVDS